MKALIFGNENKKVYELVKKAGFVITSKNPDLVVSYGGDGTFMKSEYAYPGVPKLLLRNSYVCKLCSKLLNNEVLKRVKKGDYTVKKVPKLEVCSGRKMLLGVNDIVIHNKDARHAVRYTVYVNGAQLGNEIIGDGVIVATPLGSTGYYRSITDSFFEVGMGLAFNNSTEQADHVVLKEDAKVEICITRGPAMLYADNQKESIKLEKGDKVIIKKSKEQAKIIQII